MNDKEPKLSQEMILDCKDWLSEAETVITYILKWIVKFLETVNNNEQEPKTKESTDILKFLSLARNFGNNAISLSRKSAEELQSQDPFEVLVDIKDDVRSQIIGVYSSIFLVREISRQPNNNDMQTRNLEKLVKYAEILELLSRDVEPIARAIASLRR